MEFSVSVQGFLKPENFFLLEKASLLRVLLRARNKSERLGNVVAAFVFQ